MLTKGSQIVGAELLTGDVVAWRKGMLVRVLSAQIGDAARLAWVEFEFEPLMARTEVIDLETPFGLGPMIAKFSIEDIRPVICLHETELFGRRQTRRSEELIL